MSMVDVKVNRVGDPPIFTEILSKVTMKGELTKVAVLEKGTVGGKASISLFIEMDNGKIAFVQTTAAIFEMISAIARGACASWGEELGDNLNR